MERQLPRWDSSRYQPRLNMTSVNTRNGHVSTRNAGAKASPAEVPPRKPSKPGTTHHQGKGNRTLNKATKGLSTCVMFLMELLHGMFPKLPEDAGWAFLASPMVKVYAGVKKALILLIGELRTESLRHPCRKYDLAGR